jgi:hypothetical protein
MSELEKLPMVSTALCAQVMQLIALHPPKQPDWGRLGQLVTKVAGKMPDAKPEDIAMRVLSQAKE